MRILPLPGNLRRVAVPSRSHHCAPAWGPSVPENLALACCYCNRYKGPNLSGIDPESGHVVSLFHPRQQHWDDHFAWDGARLLAKSAAARTTIHLLQINRADAVAVRRLLIQEGVFHLDPSAS